MARKWQLELAIGSSQTPACSCTGQKPAMKMAIGIYIGGFQDGKVAIGIYIGGSGIYIGGFPD